MSQIKTKVISKTVKHGENHYRLNADNTFSVLMYGSFPFQRCSGLTFRWVSIEKDKVPKEVLNEI